MDISISNTTRDADVRLDDAAVHSAAVDLRPLVLVVDDDDLMRRVASMVLQREGYQVRALDSGNAALAAMATLLPSLVVSDVGMDGLDGYGLLRAMRGDSRLAHVPVILMTGALDEAGRRKASQAGADDLLVKPFAANGLAIAVRARLGAARVSSPPAPTPTAVVPRPTVPATAPMAARATVPERATPIDHVLEIAERLEREQTTGDELETYAHALRDAAARMQRHIANIVLCSNLELLRHDPVRKAALGGAILQGAEEHVRRAATREAGERGRKDDLVLQLDPATLVIHVDALTTIVGELVRNACEHSRRGQRVEVALTSDGARGVTLAVTDQGEGFPDGAADRLAELVQATRDKNERRGSGMGLTIVMRLTEIYGGRVRLASAPGRGAAVHIDLPIATIGRAATRVAACGVRAAPKAPA